MDFPVYPPWRAKNAITKVPVVIVGGGAVGLTLALALSRRSIDVLVLEDDNRVCDGSRALGMARRTLDIWDYLGIGDCIYQIGVTWIGGRTFFRDKTILQFSFPIDSGLANPPLLNIQQSYVEQYLVEEIAKSPGTTIAWQTRLSNLNQDDKGVTLDIETQSGPHSIRADYVVACDGARSTVRRICDLHMEGTSYSAEYLIVDIKLDTPSPIERRAWFDPPSGVASTVLMHGQPENIWRIDFQLAETENIADAMKADALRERVSRHLAAIGEPGRFEIAWATTYRAHSRVLSDFRAGHIFFAGDSAHLLPIFGIRGLNSGVEDAFNLAWKLERALEGAASERLLASYSAERLYAARQNMALANRAADFMTPPTRGARLMRDAVLSLAVTDVTVRPLINPRQATFIPLSQSPLNTPPHLLRGDGLQPGDILPNLALRQTGEAKTLYAGLGNGFSLVLANDTLPLPEEINTLLGRYYINPLVVGAVPAITGSAIPDEDRCIRNRLGLDGGNALLVRPDHHIAARLAPRGLAELERAARTAMGLQ
jgi:3-(3-hydroxy-phenyl)propionate hydroxylase